MNLYVGLKFRTANNDIAEIIGIEGQNVRLLYQDKIFTLSKHSLYKFNIKPFVVNSQTATKIQNKKKTDTSKQFHKSCNNCMEMKNGNCIGHNSICSDYRPSPEISIEETARWPKMGDASYYRTHKLVKSRN